MDPQASDRITVITNPTFSDLFIGSMLLIRYQRLFIVFHLVFPLVGVFLLLTPLLGYRLGPVEILLALGCFSFTPLITAIAVWAGRRQSQTARGPVTYVFDAEGMHTSGPTFSQTIRWSGICRVRRLKGFLFVFIGPARAYCIPLRDLSEPDDLGRLLSMAGAHVDCR